MPRQIKACRVLVLMIAVLVFGVMDGVAQNVKITTDPNRNIAGFQKYAWRENHIVAKQTPEGTATIEATVKKAIDRELAQKSCVLDPQNPDFFIHFDGGGDFTSDASAVADPRLPIGAEVYKTQNPVGPGVNILAITIMKVSIIVTSPPSDAPAWQADATKKIQESGEGAERPR